MPWSAQYLPSDLWRFCFAKQMRLGKSKPMFEFDRLLHNLTRSQTQFTYSCVCANGTVPDCTAFAETLPYFLCQATYAQCVEAHPNDAQGQSVCETNQQCGTRNATAEALAATSAAQSSSASSTSSSASSSSSASGSATAASSSASSSPTGNAAVGLSQQLTTGAFAALLVAACKFLL